MRCHCPFCGGRFREFLARGVDFSILQEKKVIGDGYRLNATCPCCRSYDRERLTYLFLKQKTDLFARKIKLLHFAQKNIDYVTADLMAPDVMVKADVTAIPYSDVTFDAVICNHVLEHIADDRKAMAELYRVFKPGGRAYLQVPCPSRRRTRTSVSPSRKGANKLSDRQTTIASLPETTKTG